MAATTHASDRRNAASVKAASIQQQRSPMVNLRKQAKYAAIGFFGVWYWQVQLHLSDALLGGYRSILVASTAIALYLATIGLFAHVLLLPTRGYRVDYLQWQKDENLKVVIPLLTASIVFGYIVLFLALSPLIAPRPPSPAFSERLLEAANAAGGNLSKATAGIQLMLADTARSLGLSGKGSPDFLDVTSMMRTLRLPDGDALAGRLGVSKDQTKVLVATLDRYQRRAQAWKENNVSMLGWTGAACGAGSAFVLLFGVIGLVGLFAPRNAKTRQASL